MSIGYLHAHPYHLTRVDQLLWSINERLGGNAGLDVPAPSTTWVSDLIVHSKRIQEEIEANS
jgi:hypothetical protein